MARGRVNRRAFLGLAGAAAGGAVIGAGAELAAHADAGDDAGHAGPELVPFYGPRQAGIVTPAQDRLHMAAFDVSDGTSRTELRDMLAAWTGAAARMTAGQAIGRVDDLLAPPPDTGEADGLPAARLTVTFGFGPGLFGSAGRDRFGLAAKRPAALNPLPPLARDELDPDRSGGDLCVQACADDPQVAFHAVRNLARIGRGVVTMRWSQLGFGRTSRTTDAQVTPRNLMGFKDGTRNLTAENTKALDRFVWIGGEAPPWMRGGTYLVARRIRMLIEVWDRASLGDQEQTIGRIKASGAPLGRHAEHDPIDLRAQGANGPVIPADAHIRLAAPTTNEGQRILRRGYSFTDGFDPELGQLDAGLFFIAFQRDPEKQFAAIQERLGKSDALNEYIKHVSSAVFAVPPGVRARGGSIGDGLFGA
jgi:deferrochelatase/peroxidase EfeB